MSDKNAQMKYLKDRLDSVARRKNVFWNHGDEIKLHKPAEVRAAEARIKADGTIINRFLGKVKRANERHRERKKQAYEACRKEVFFGDPRKALKMLDKFEKDF